MLSNYQNVTGVQKSKPNQASNRTLDPLVSPIAPQDLAEFIGAIYDPAQDAFLTSFLLAASAQYIAYTNNELLSRDYVYKLDRWPEQSPSYSGLGFEPARGHSWIDIPLNPVLDVTQVMANGQNITANVSLDLSSKPQRILTETSWMQDIQVDYSAGYATAENIPQSAIVGIKMLAAYLYEHRGD